jgi:hypothetical protein
VGEQSGIRKLFIKLGELKEDRRALFQALFLKIAIQAEASWELFDRLPYQTGYARRPFRNPTVRASEARSLWLQNLVSAVQEYDQDITWFAAWALVPGYLVPDTLAIYSPAQSRRVENRPGSVRYLDFVGEWEPRDRGNGPACCSGTVVRFTAGWLAVYRAVAARAQLRKACAR